MSPVPKWLAMVAVAVLLWNLVGLLAVISEAIVGDSVRATLTEAQRAVSMATPDWAKAGTAIGFGAGALGALVLMFRGRAAPLLLGLSLFGFLVQDVWLFGVSQAVSVFGLAIWGQVVVLAISLGILMLSRRAQAEGWLR